MTKTDQRILKKLLHSSSVTIRGRRETLALRAFVPLGVTIRLLNPDDRLSPLIMTTGGHQSTFEGSAIIHKQLETLESIKRG